MLADVKLSFENDVCFLSLKNIDGRESSSCGLPMNISLHDDGAFENCAVYTSAAYTTAKGRVCGLSTHNTATGAYYHALMKCGLQMNMSRQDGATAFQNCAVYTSAAFTTAKGGVCGLNIRHAPGAYHHALKKIVYIYTSASKTTVDLKTMQQPFKTALCTLRRRS